MVPRLFAAALALWACVAVHAQAPALDATLNESVEMVPKKGLIFSIPLETTIFRPPGAGPFPIVVINHGKELGDPRFQARYRPLDAARFFVERGYAVVVPMRQGFANSGGGYIGVDCNFESNGRVQAEDLAAVIDHLSAQPWADASRIVVAGYSHGGWTTLAYGLRAAPGVKGLINFAGGLRADICPNWREALASASGLYGRATKLPSVWFYGDNDSVFDRRTSDAMFERYREGGADVRLVAFGNFGRDAHGVFVLAASARVWQPEVMRFLQRIGLPYERLDAHAHLGVATDMPRPEPTRFSPYDDESRVPFVPDTGRAGYRVYLGRPLPRAFAVAPNGAWGWAEGEDDPLKRALENCNRGGAGTCRLYSVDTDVVWRE